MKKLTHVLSILLTCLICFSGSELLASTDLTAAAKSIQSYAPNTAALFIEIDKLPANSPRKTNALTYADALINFYNTMKSKGDFYFMLSVVQGMDTPLPNFQNFWMQSSDRDRLNSLSRFQSIEQYTKRIENQKKLESSGDNLVVLQDMQKILKKNNYSIPGVDDKLKDADLYYTNIKKKYSDTALIETNLATWFGKKHNLLALKNLLLFVHGYSDSAQLNKKIDIDINNIQTDAVKMHAELVQKLNSIQSKKITTNITFGLTLDEILNIYLMNDTVTASQFLQMYEAVEGSTTYSKGVKSLPLVKDMKTTYINFSGNNIRFNIINLIDNEYVFFNNKLIAVTFFNIPTAQDNDIIQALEKKYGENKAKQGYLHEDDQLYVSLLKEARGGNYKKTAIYFANTSAILEIVKLEKESQKEKDAKQKEALNSL